MTELQQSFQQAKELIRQRLDLVTLVGEVVPLKRSGRSFKGLCPFHEEKTPSFHVHPESQVFRCYGCGEGGDLFAWIMKREGLGFREALEELAERAGVDLPKAGRGERRGPGRNQLIEVLSTAQAFFAERLRGGEGAEARAYVAQRGLDAAVGSFGLGFAPGPRPDGARRWPLVEELERAGVALPLAAELGLIGRTERGQWYDRFRNRLTFPIHDGQGRIVGFGGRILPGHESEREPKYLNSPESPVFNKRNLLFGLSKARQAKARRLIVMEGYTDVIACHLAGLPEAVATLGTSLTKEHASLIRRYAPDGTVLLFDGDEAGRRAAERAYAALAGETLPARICLLEGGQDPADLAGTKGREGVEEILAGARDALEVWIELLGRRFDSGSHEGKMAMADACREVLRELGDPLRRDDLADRMARLLFVAPDQLLAGVRSRRKPPAAASAPLGEPARRSAQQRVEDTVLEVLLRDPTELEALEELWPDEDLGFEDPVGAALIARLQAWVLDHGHHPSPAELCGLWVDHVTGDPERLAWLMDLEEASRALSEPRQALADGVMFLRNHRSQNEIRQLRESIARTRRDGGAAETRELEKELSRLMKSAAQGGPAP